MHRLATLVLAAVSPAVAVAVTTPVTAQADPEVVATGFDDVAAGPLHDVDSGGGAWRAEPDHAAVHADHHRSPPHALRILGGADRTVTVRFADAPRPLDELTFHAERWTARAPFAFRVEGLATAGWTTLWNGDDEVAVGRFRSHVRVPLAAAGPLRALRFVATSPPGTGVLIDDVVLLRPVPMRIVRARQRIPAVPVLLGARDQPLLEIEIDTVGSSAPRTVVAVHVTAGGRLRRRVLDFVRLDADGATGWSSASPLGIPLSQPVVLRHGTNRIVVVGTASAEAGLDDRVALRCTELELDEGPARVPEVTPDSAAAQRFGIALRRGGDDGVHTSRIPALVRSDAGTLIAAFDLRHRGAGDLPGDIDVGVRRSTDGGRTWTGTARALDMGEPHAENGVGDPCLLVDAVTGRIWLFALWCRGDTGWNGSRPGLEPGVTGQLVAAWSDDDGATWASPRNLTRELKDPAWRLFLQGPGAGITTRDGVLVIPAQFRDADGLPHATVVSSADRGATWQVGTGARPDTTESAVVELADGSWMLNMRDNRGGARAVAVTRDRGRTWAEHPTSRTALPEPVCMASLLRVPGGPAGDVLLFSNPAVAAPPRRRISIRVSRDDGAAWSAGLLLDERRSAGYSCLAPVDAARVGILYEGSGAHLVFQRVPLAELLELR